MFSKPPYSEKLDIVIIKIAIKFDEIYDQVK